MADRGVPQARSKKQETRNAGVGWRKYSDFDARVLAAGTPAGPRRARTFELSTRRIASKPDEPPHSRYHEYLPGSSQSLCFDAGLCGIESGHFPFSEKRRLSFCEPG